MFIKAEVGFEHPAQGPHHCGECEHFKGNGACQIVQGAISPEDWCEKWKKQMANWMKAAVPPSHKGKFTAKAEAAGMSVAAYAKKEEHAPGTLGKEARLAQTFEHEGARKVASKFRRRKTA